MVQSLVQSQNHEIGSFQCTCGEGFQQVEDLDECENVNECLVDAFDCKPHQFCVDTYGSYEAGFQTDAAILLVETLNLRASSCKHHLKTCVSAIVNLVLIVLEASVLMLTNVRIGLYESYTL